MKWRTFKVIDVNRAKVYEAIDSERDYQVLRWGHRQADGSFKESHKTTAEYLTFIRHYLSEAEKAASTECGYEGALEMLRKVAGLCVACFEQNGVAKRHHFDLRNVVNGVDNLPAVDL